MKISVINNVYRIPRQSYTKTQASPAHTFINNTLNADVVSFGAKKYDSESIINPTNHCAYCGCKVYSEQQIDGIAKEILASKTDRLEGKIKSVLEKLDDAKNSQEIAIAKRIENNEEIDFFKRLLEASSKKPYLRGEALFEQVYQMSKDEALDCLIKNMHPLLKTIDHISPQNLEQDNKDSDVNLVEACYCCNHDLKKGVSFNEFYTMFPGIKFNMPAEKFKYAQSQMDNPEHSIFRRFSVENMLKLVDRLFVQRNETYNYLSSLNHRIEECKPKIVDLIAFSQEEIKEKEAEIISLNAELAALQTDDEYKAMLERYNLQSELSKENNLLESLRNRWSKISNGINDLKNSLNPNNNKKKEPLTEEEKEEKLRKIQSMQANLVSLEAEIKNKVLNIENIKMKIGQISSKFPTIEMLQIKKSENERILNAYDLLIKLNSEYAHLQENDENYKQEEKKLIGEISFLPSGNFNISDYDEDTYQQYTRYQELKEASSYIRQHPNGGVIKAVIKQAAQLQIDSELQALESNPVIKKYNQIMERKSLESELVKKQEKILNIENEMVNLSKQIKAAQEITSEMPKDEAEENIKSYSERIRRLTEKQNDVKIPQIVATLEAEITLLKRSVDDLQKKYDKINDVLTLNT